MTRALSVGLSLSSGSTHLVQVLLQDVLHLPPLGRLRSRPGIQRPGECPDFLLSILSKEHPLI